MADIWNLNALCRCCHKDGYFRSMQYPYVGKDGEVEVYGSWLKEVFGIIMETPPVPASIMICEECIASLRDGRKFKKQVMDCELRFQQYCRNEVKVEPGENSQPGKSKLLQGFNFVDSDFPKKSEDNKIKIKIELDIDQHDNTHDLNTDNIDNADHFDNNAFDSDSDLEPLIAKKENNKKEKKSDTIVKGKVSNQITIKAKAKSNTAKKGKVATKGKDNKISANKPNKKAKSTTISYRCHKCGIYQKTRREMKQHMETQHKEPEINCQFCDEKILGLLKYKFHVNKMHPGVGIVCKYCPEIYPQGYLLKNHVQQCHSPADNKIIYICDYCQREFLDKAIMRTHILRVHMKKKNHTCGICNLQTYDKAHLKYHIEQVHENVRKFKCEICPDKKYKTAKMLKIHTRLTHTNERPYVCVTCGEAFVTQSDLNRHTFKYHYDGNKCENEMDNRKIRMKDGTIQEVPPGGRVFRCFMCKEAFPSRGAYRKHLNKDHKGMMPHQCHICANTFASTYVLQRHILSHETTRKFKCHLCLGTFKHEIFLTAHVKRTHGDLNRDGTPRVSKEDYVKCDICHRMVPNIEKHKALHFKRPFKCHLCDRDYSMNNALQRHIRETHLGISFSCDICDKKFSKPRSVNRHKMKHHPGEYERERQVKTEVDD